MNILDELQTLLWKRSRQFEREAKKALTEDLSIVYRAKAAEAYSIYIILLNMKKKAMQDGKADYEDFLGYIAELKKKYTEGQ